MKTNQFTRPQYKAEDWITKEEACQLLGIKPKSLGNLIWAGKIPDRFISTGVGGNKFFHKPGLMGFNK